jgi:hypothetical protein
MIFDLRILKSLFLLILVMAGGFIGDIFGCRAKKILTHNILVKQIVFISLIYFTIDFTQDDNESPLDVVKLTISLWIFYMLIIRMNIYFTSSVASLLFALYVIDEYYEYIVEYEFKTITNIKSTTITNLTYNISNIESEINDPQMIIDNMKKLFSEDELSSFNNEFDNLKATEIIDKLLVIISSRHNYLKEIIKWMEYLIILLTIIGLISYILQQRKDKGKKFSFTKFLLGDGLCQWEK